MRMTSSEVWNGDPARGDQLRDRGTRAGGDDDAVAGEGRPVLPHHRATVGRGHLERPLAGEAGVAEVDRRVRCLVLAVALPAGGDRVDPGEHPVADVGPADLVDARVHAVDARPADRLGDVGGVDVHLGRDAADVQAGPAEHPVLDDRHVHVREPFVRDRVAGAGADDDEVVVGHALHGSARPNRTWPRRPTTSGPEIAVHRSATDRSSRCDHSMVTFVDGNRPFIVARRSELCPPGLVRGRPDCWSLPPKAPRRCAERPPAERRTDLSGRGSTDDERRARRDHHGREDPRARRDGPR